jgi:hypothetical protein
VALEDRAVDQAGPGPGRVTWAGALMEEAPPGRHYWSRVWGRRSSLHQTAQKAMQVSKPPESCTESLYMHTHEDVHSTPLFTSDI